MFRRNGRGRPVARVAKFATPTLLPHLWRRIMHNNTWETAQWKLCFRVTLGGSGGETSMKSLIVKRSIVIAGHKTSVSLEDAFWRALKEIAGRRDMALSALVASIDAEHAHANLSSAIRLFILGFYRTQLSQGMAARNASQEEMAVIPATAFGG